MVGRYTKIFKNAQKLWKGLLKEISLIDLNTLSNSRYILRKNLQRQTEVTNMLIFFMMLPYFNLFNSIQMQLFYGIICLIYLTWRCFQTTFFQILSNEASSMSTNNNVIFIKKSAQYFCRFIFMFYIYCLLVTVANLRFVPLHLYR